MILTSKEILEIEAQKELMAKMYQAAKTNPALRKALDNAILLYKLGEQNGR